jgi:hypothetical protein
MKKPWSLAENQAIPVAWLRRLQYTGGPIRQISTDGAFMRMNNMMHTIFRLLLAILITSFARAQSGAPAPGEAQTS